MWLESGEGVELLCRWRLGPERGGRGGSWRVEREAMGLGFGARGETVRLENGDGSGDSLRFYVAITLPQMPLSEMLYFLTSALAIHRLASTLDHPPPH